MKAENSQPPPFAMWSGEIIKGKSTDYYRVGFNLHPYFYLPDICHRDYGSRHIINYKDPFLGWGYRGDGPKQLALTILNFTNFVGVNRRRGSISTAVAMSHEILALKHHVAFMEEVISKLPDKWELTEEFILDWLKGKEGKEKDHGKMARKEN